MKHPTHMAQTDAQKILLEHAYGAGMWEQEEDAEQGNAAPGWGALSVAAAGVLLWVYAAYYLFVKLDFPFFW